MNRDPLWHGANKIDGYQDWMLANRISYEFGLTGPRFAPPPQFRVYEATDFV